MQDSKHDFFNSYGSGFGNLLYVKDMARRFCGLSKDKCCCLIYEYAERNNVHIAENWRVNKKAGQGFWLEFKSRHILAIRSLEPASLARVTVFNMHTVREFFSNLAKVMDCHKFLAQDIPNIDETGCTTVQNPGRVVERGIKQVASVTSAEREELVTVVNVVNANGSVLPPTFVFLRVNIVSGLFGGHQLDLQDQLQDRAG